jgi:alpha-tubulin suppressor-like RCC1 family protein
MRTTMPALVSASLLVMLLSLLACDEHLLETPPLEVQLRWTPLTDTLIRGETREYSLIAVDSQGNEIRGLQVAIGLSDSAVANVDVVNSGRNVRIRARGNGRTEMTFSISSSPSHHAVELKDTIQVMEHWYEVSAGFDHACAVNLDRQPFCWGTNALGSLGNSYSHKCNPADIFPCSSLPVPVLGNHRFEVIAAGPGGHSCGLTANGFAYCWGNNFHGALGTNSQRDQCGSFCSWTPHPVWGNIAYRSLTAGRYFTCALTPDSRPHCWGSHEDGSIGAGPDPVRCIDYKCTVPVPVASAQLYQSIAKTAAAGSMCAISLSGDTYCWGAMASALPGAVPGCRGLSCSTAPVIIPGAIKLRSVVVGSNFFCGLTENNGVYCWGSNYFGQFGNGASTPERTGIPVRGASGMTFVELSAGSSHVCGHQVDGNVYCWGDNHFGQLGTPTSELCGANSCSSRPLRVAPSVRFRLVRAGDVSTCGISDRGALYCWGPNSNGQLGNGTIRDSPLPIRVQNPM